MSVEMRPPADLPRTPSGLVIATPENLARLLSMLQPPERIWWERAGMELCLVPTGSFLMGSSDEDRKAYNDEKPPRRVHLDAYYVARYPTTQAQYARFVRETAHRVPFKEVGAASPYDWEQTHKLPPAGLEHHPVVLVSWDDAVAYCRWAGLRLPTEAEWEKAARGTDGRIYPWGDAWDPTRCNSAEGGKGGTTPVGAYSPAGDSPYGCADMAGNVAEWVADSYAADSCARSPDRHPRGLERVPTGRLRGGNWTSRGHTVRAAYRYLTFTITRIIGIGFRCAA